MSAPRLRLGQLLVDAKLISAEALAEVLQAQQADGRRLGTLLVERGLVNETQLTQILSHQLSVPWVSLLHIEFSRQLLNLVPRDVAEHYCLVPIYVRHVRNQGDTLYVAMDDPQNEDGLRACREHSGLPVRAMIAPPADIRNAIRVYYGVEPARPAAAPEPAAAPRPEDVATEPPPPVEQTPAPVGEAPAPAAEVAPTAEPPAEAPAAEAPAPVAPVAEAPAAEAPPAEAVGEQPAAVPEEAAAAPEQAPAEAPAPAEVHDGPEIEAVEIPLDEGRAQRLREILDRPASPPSEPPVENIPRPRGRAPRMVALTLLDGTTIPLPARRRARPRPADGEPEPSAQTPPSQPPPPPSQPPPSSAPVSEPPGPEGVQGLTARDLVLALRVVSHGADASEVLGADVNWQSLFAALLSLMLKKHLIADWEFVEELKKNL